MQQYQNKQTLAAAQADTNTNGQTSQPFAPEICGGGPIQNFIHEIFKNFTTQCQAPGDGWKQLQQVERIFVTAIFDNIMVVYVQHIHFSVVPSSQGIQM
jgi:enamine deaminase RidA (YjgF/YER057c/UK114 family)